MRHQQQRSKRLFASLYLACLVVVVLDTASASKVSLFPRHSQKNDKLFASARITEVRGGSSQRRWERMDGKDLGGRSSLLAAAGSNVYGRACGFYIWDAPSALLHRWCHHLLKECVYEGLGGRKFVRIEPGSILQLLYPCSRYSPDRCIICGGTQHDHLALSWARHLYTPFDQYLDKTREAATVLEQKYPSTAKSRLPRRKSGTQRSRPRSNSGKNSSSSVDLTETRTIFAYHRKYVLDVETLLFGIINEKERAAKLRKELARIQKESGTPMELRMLPFKKKAYLVPAIVHPSSDNSNSKTTDSQQQQRTSATFVFTRYIFLNAVDRLIGLQESENDKIRRREQEIGCCP